MKLSFTAAEAFENSRANIHRAWIAGNNNLSVRARLSTDDVFHIGHRPRFHLEPNTSVFTMGSCFAREIENFLINARVAVVLKDHGIPAEHFESWKEGESPFARGSLSRGAFNKYSVHSMSHEIRRTLRDESHPDEGLIQLDDRTWFDPHSSGLKALNYETAIANRRRIAAATAELRNADVVFLTLGLTETWLDNETGLAMNSHPGATWLRRLQDRFTFIDFGFDATLRELTSTIELIRRMCNSEMRFILTISPVPLGVTFKPIDIVVANSGSKALLRTVAEELYRTYDYVDYFPSYELVTHSPRNKAWLEDQLHVSRQAVDGVVQTFIDSYYGQYL